MIMNKNKLLLFEERKIRRVWHNEDWYYSVVDVIEVLTESIDAKDYWYRLKKREKDESKTELSTICRQLKLESSDGKKYLTDCASTKGILRIIQSVPSPKAEPFKMWLAEVGNDRIEEINNPELGYNRMREIYEKKGYNKGWIAQREKTIDTRNLLTDEWKDRGAKNGLDFAILTNEIYKGGFGMDAREYKDYKGVSKKGNLRDSMSNLELALTNLGEATATEIHKDKNSIGMGELKEDVALAGAVTKESRLAVEKALNRSVITKQNSRQLNQKF